MVTFALFKCAGRIRAITPHGVRSPFPVLWLGLLSLSGPNWRCYSYDKSNKMPAPSNSGPDECPYFQHIAEQPTFLTSWTNDGRIALWSRVRDNCIAPRQSFLTPHEERANSPPATCLLVRHIGSWCANMNFYECAVPLWNKVHKITKSVNRLYRFGLNLLYATFETLNLRLNYNIV